MAVWSAVTLGLKLLLPGVPPVLGVVLYSGVIEFLYGGLISLAISAGWRAGAVPALVVGALGLAVMVSGQFGKELDRSLVAGLPSAALVYGLAAGSWKMPNWVMVWGEASYLLYLVHLLVFSITGTLLRMVGVAPYGSDLVMLGLAALAIAVSVGATLWLERPYRAWVKGR